jgi:hypothetical protein
MPARVDGNVIITGGRNLDSIAWEQDGIKLQTKRRFQLAPGAYMIAWNKHDQCGPTPILVPKDQDFAYMWLDVPADAPPPPKTGPKPCEDWKVRRQYFFKFDD